MTNTRHDELASFLEEAHLRVSDGTRPLRTSDARQLADELLFGDGSPTWIAHIEPHAASAAIILAQHASSMWVDDAVESGPWGTGGWVCQCGTVITTGDLSVPAGADVPAGAMWLARHQVAMLSMRGAL
ncbi:MAG: hypothetical protein J0J04_08110 [Microbacterium sp.]|uniref:hypothetical protein n=1 Tax=Microbacterium sp. TaxID=51671 RepID=UPI001AC1EFAC|nr:hypothetical protein [Microbacterium sp.]MBN9214764.1 hypothetical protein [Microbacterium sp.]